MWDKSTLHCLDSGSSQDWTCGQTPRWKEWTGARFQAYLCKGSGAQEGIVAHSVSDKRCAAANGFEEEHIQHHARHLMTKPEPAQKKKKNPSETDFQTMEDLKHWFSGMMSKGGLWSWWPRIKWWLIMPPGELISTWNSKDTKSRGLPTKILGQEEMSTSTLCDLLERNILSYSVTKQSSPARL